LMAALFAWFVVERRADQIITGTAITLLGLGVTGTAYVGVYGEAGAALQTPTIGPVALPVLSTIPWIGPTLFTQSAATYAVLLLVPAVAWWLGRTTSGLALRAVGERADAAAAAGISVTRMRWGALFFAGAMGGLCGATLVLADVGTFNEGMSAGRGFIAIAIVVLGRWTALGVAGAAFVFGGAFALRSLLQTLGLPLPYQLFLALPYALTLVLLAVQRGRAVAPGELGSGLDR